MARTANVPPDNVVCYSLRDVAGLTRRSIEKARALWAHKTFPGWREGDDYYVDPGDFRTWWVGYKDARRAEKEQTLDLTPKIGEPNGHISPKERPVGGPQAIHRRPRRKATAKLLGPDAG